MHFLLGWPSTLKLPALPPLKPTQSGQATGAEAAAAAASVVTEPIRSFATNQQRTKTAVVTDTAVYLFHFQQVPTQRLTEALHGDADRSDLGLTPLQNKG